MGVGDGDAVADDDRRSIVCGISCSICLEAVIDDGTRSLAKLLCGHQFHLDCIGSAFNAKGAMECPNCRKVEKGQWLYANSSRPLPDFVMDDWVHEEDTSDLSYSEMSFGVHWCPFSGLTGLPSSFDEGEFPSSTYRDLMGHHAVFAEPTPVTSTNHPCPYIAYLGPIHPSSSTSNGSVSDGSSYNSHWNGPSPNDVIGSYAFPSLNVHYHSWDPSSPFSTANRIGGPDQPLVPPRAARNSSDIPRPAIQPFFLGHSSASRAPSSVSMVPPYSAAVARPHRERPSLQANYQQSTSNPQVARVPPIINNGRISSGSHRGALAHVAPMVASSSTEHQNNGGFYFFSSARTYQEPEITHHHHFHFWEHDYQPSSFPERDSSPSIWGPLYPPNGGVGSSDIGGIRSYGSHAWHGSSQNRS